MRIDIIASIFSFQLDLRLSLTCFFFRDLVSRDLMKNCSRFTWEALEKRSKITIFDDNHVFRSELWTTSGLAWSWFIQTRRQFWLNRHQDDPGGPRRRNSPWAKSTRTRCRSGPGRCCWAWRWSWTKAFYGCWSWAEQTWNRNDTVVSVHETRTIFGLK